MSNRGSILAQVLVSMAFIAIISASILRMRMQPAIDAANRFSRLSENLETRSALNRLTESWARLGTCASDAAADLSCSGSGCNCSCTVGSVLITAAPQGGACALSAVLASSP